MLPGAPHSQVGGCQGKRGGLAPFYWRDKTATSKIGSEQWRVWGLVDLSATSRARARVSAQKHNLPVGESSGSVPEANAARIMGIVVRHTPRARECLGGGIEFIDAGETGGSNKAARDQHLSIAKQSCGVKPAR